MQYTSVQKNPFLKIEVALKRQSNWSRLLGWIVIEPQTGDPNRQFDLTDLTSVSVHVLLLLLVFPSLSWVKDTFIPKLTMLAFHHYWLKFQDKNWKTSLRFVNTPFSMWLLSWVSQRGLAEEVDHTEHCRTGASYRHPKHRSTALHCTDRKKEKKEIHGEETLRKFPFSDKNWKHQVSFSHKSKTGVSTLYSESVCTSYQSILCGENKQTAKVL